MEPRTGEAPADEAYAPPFRGEARLPGGEARPAAISFGRGTFLLGLDGQGPATIAYRDLATIAIEDGVGLLVAGEGPDAPRWLLERWGAALGPVVAQLRERRLRQRLADGLVEVPDGPIPLVEYARPGPDGGAGPDAGVAHLTVHPWGAVVAPLDERRPWIRLRRAGIGAVDAEPATAGLRVHADDGRPVVDLPRLGPAAAGIRADLEALRDGAVTDAGAILASLAPDLPFATRDRAARMVVDGRPADRASLEAAWGPIEAAVLTELAFAASYAALVERAGGDAAVRWFAMAPEAPGSPMPRTWFLVALPGNLVALELVSGGAHATYCFRAGPRAEHPGGPTDPAAASARVRAVSEALIDARFLREPIALPDERLARPEGRRYRLALAALPALAAARAAFVARLVHRDETTWAAALDDLMAWHDAQRDDGAVWPGRAGQESQIDEAAGGVPDPDPGPAVPADAGGPGASSG